MLSFDERTNTSVFCTAAPKVNLTANASIKGGLINVTEGSKLSFNCDYDDVTPSGNQTVFNLNGNEATKLKVSITFNCDYGDITTVGNQTIFDFNANETVKFKL